MCLSGSSACMWWHRTPVGVPAMFDTTMWRFFTCLPCPRGTTWWDGRGCSHTRCVPAPRCGGTALLFVHLHGIWVSPFTCLFSTYLWHHEQAYLYVCYLPSPVPQCSSTATPAHNLFHLPVPHWVVLFCLFESLWCCCTALVSMGTHVHTHDTA